MSTATLRHHAITLSFLTHRRERQLTKSVRTLRIRASRRRIRQLLRSLVANAYA